MNFIEKKKMSFKMVAVAGGIKSCMTQFVLCSFQCFLFYGP